MSQLLTQDSTLLDDFNPWQVENWEKYQDMAAVPDLPYPTHPVSLAVPLLYEGKRPCLTSFSRLSHLPRDFFSLHFRFLARALPVHNQSPIHPCHSTTNQNLRKASTGKTNYSFSLPQYSSRHHQYSFTQKCRTETITERAGTQASICYIYTQDMTVRKMR